VHDDYILATEVRHFEAQYDSGNPAPNVVVDVEAKLLTLPIATSLPCMMSGTRRAPARTACRQ
jgi:hypothetical protein